MSPEQKSWIDGLPARLVAGDEQAFLDFANAFNALFLKFFLQKRIPEVAAQDLAATCMTDIPLKVVKGMYVARPEGGFRSWVYTVMRNCASDWWRENGRISSNPLPVDFPAPGPDVAGDLLRTAAVQEGVAQLGPTDREIIELHDLGEIRTYIEIAALLEISPSAARVRHHRAVNALRKILEDDARIHLR